MRKRVRLWMRPTFDQQKYTFYLIYYDKGLCPVSNFRYQFRAIMVKAGTEKGEFHDLRRTCLTNWLANGFSEYDVMTMAGHASFETTRRFFLAVRKDVLDRARKASLASLKFIFVEKLLQRRTEDGTNKY